MQSYGFVYETTNKINGMKYVGKCEYGRINSWEKYLGSGVLLLADIKKFGRENFVRVILEEANTKEDLLLLEEKYIRLFNCVESSNYYNVKFEASGGDTFTHNPRKEDIRILKRQNMAGSNNHQYGKPKTKKMIDSVVKANSKPIMIDEILYSSASDASRKLGIGNTTILYRLESKNFPNYYRP